jgi:hypothetical protein
LVEQVDARQCGSNGEQLCFRVYVKNFFIRMLADDLFLSYSNNKELLQFKGVSNVVDADGSAIKTQVQYSFSPKLNEVEYYSQEVFAF